MSRRSTTLSDITTATDPPRKRLVFSGEPPAPRVRRVVREFFDIDPERVSHTDEPIRSRSEASQTGSQVSIVGVYADGSDDPLLVTDVETLWTAVTSDAESLATDTGTSDHPTDVFESIGATRVSSHTTQQMLVASRHIERRAHEIEAGEIHTCFQRLSLLGEDLRTVVQYNLLAAKGIEVHVYGYADHDLPDIQEPIVHGGEAEELAASWVVAFDNGRNGADRKTAVLVAQEQETNEYAGFWAFDPDTTRAVIDHMTSTYH